MTTDAVNILVNAKGNAARRFGGYAQSFRNMAKALFSVKGAAVAAVGAFGGFKLLQGTIGTGVKLAADMEQAEVAFSTMLGSADKAKQTLVDLQDFAASTPFQLPGLTDAAKKLLAFNVAQEDLIPTMRKVGDISAGIGAPIGEIAEIFGKAKVQGRLFMEDINQLTGRGIPIIQELAKQFGVAESEVRELVSSGKVNFGNLQQAFTDLTADGAKFGGLMAAQSETLSGLWSTLKDRFGLVAMSIGQQLLPVFKSLIRVTLEFMPIIESVGRILGEFVVGAFKLFMRIGVGAFTAVEVVVTKWRDIFKLSFVVAKLALIGFWEDLKHLFGTTIPTLLDWFGRNWKEIIADIFNATVTIVKNQMTKMVDIVKRTWEFLTSGFEGGFGNFMADVSEIATRNLLEGFTKTAEDLPELMGRKLTDEERRLAAEAGRLGNDIGRAFTDKYEQRLKAFGLGPDELGGPGGPGDAADPQKIADAAAPKITVELEKADRTKGLKLTEARLLTRASGFGSQPLERQAEATERTAKESEKQTAEAKKQTAALEEIAAGRIVVTEERL